LCSDYSIQYQAALGGVGVALLSRRAVWFGLKDGTLTHVAKEWSVTELSIYLIFVGRRGMLPSVRTLVDYLVANLSMAMAE
jgi:DNA-binding transcriptional LysR family regulator